MYVLNTGYAETRVGSRFKDGRLFLYREKVDAYWNDWSGMRVYRNISEGEIKVYIYGEGKTSEFDGIVSINCSSKSAGEWIAGRNFFKSLNKMQIAKIVPSQVVNVARRLFCTRR